MHNKSIQLPAFSAGDIFYETPYSNGSVFGQSERGDYWLDPFGQQACSARGAKDHANQQGTTVVVQDSGLLGIDDKGAQGYLKLEQECELGVYQVWQSQLQAYFAGGMLECKVEQPYEDEITVDKYKRKGEKKRRQNLKIKKRKKHLFPVSNFWMVKNRNPQIFNRQIL